jgi:hypothetical protein
MWLQYLLVAVIVLAAVLFAIWRLPGNPTRRRYIASLRRLSGGQGPLNRLALRLEARMARAEGSSACSSCSSAGDHGKAPPGPRPG